MSKRQSLKGKGIDDLLFGISENHKELAEAEKGKRKSEVKKLRSSVLDEDMEAELERLTVPLPFDQVQALSKLERSIMKNRSRNSKKQRITKNSIIRACLEVFLTLDLDTNEIPDETELARRIERTVG